MNHILLNENVSSRTTRRLELLPSQRLEQGNSYNESLSEAQYAASQPTFPDENTDPQTSSNVYAALDPAEVSKTLSELGDESRDVDLEINCAIPSVQV